MSLAEFLGFAFIQKALFAGVFLALACSLLGVVLVLRRLSLIGDGLAHVTFGGLAAGLVLNVYPLYASLPIVMISSVGIWRLTERARILGDAAIGIVSSLGIASGVILVSLADGFNVDLMSYLFGNILAITGGEAASTPFIAAAVVAFMTVYQREILSVSFDEEFARASGIDHRKINRTIILLAAVVVVFAMKMAGIMLASALLILPAVTALQFALGFKATLVLAGSFGVLAVIGGVAAAFFLDLPAGATIVLANFCFFLLARIGAGLGRAKGP